jgi:Tol biopolymer transport system component
MVVEQALEKDPAARYQTMRDLVVDLRRAARERGESIRPAADAARTRQRWRVAVALATLVVAAAIGFWAISGLKAGWRNPLEGATFTRLTDFEGVETDAVISPDGNFVAFISDRDGTMDVWVLQIASGQFRNLTEGKVPNILSTQVRVLAFSPDGSHVTIMTRRANAGDLGTSIIPTIGGPIRVLLDGGAGPQWSSDGNRLAFFKLIQNRDVVYVADRDGANAREAFPEKPGGHNHFLAWSPSGRYLYTARSTRNVQEADIWRPPVAGAGGRP